MNMYDKLKAIWKKLGIDGQVKNYSDVDLWVVENITHNRPVAYILPPGFKTPAKIDVDGFKRGDGKPIQGHKNWWKFYDFSTVDVYKDGRGLRLSVVTKIAVPEGHFGKVQYLKRKWGEPIVAILDVKRNSSGNIVSYLVSGYGWLDFETAFKMTCHHEIDNARPVFPSRGKPYIRSKRDKKTLNNFSKKGLA